jgi:hypothetical protein
LAPETLLATGALIQFTGERRAAVAAQAFKRWRKFSRTRVMTAAQEEIARCADPTPSTTVVGGKS